MRVIVLVFLISVNFIFPLSVWSKSKSGDYFYHPIDHIQLPDLGKKWSFEWGLEKLRARYVVGQKNPGTIPAQLILNKQLLSDRELKNDLWWKNLKRDLNKDKKDLQVLERDNNVQAVTWTETQHLIPLQVESFYHRSENYLYTWQCRQEKNRPENLGKLCEDTFSKIRWTPKVSPKKFKDVAFSELVREINFDDQGFYEYEQKLFSKLKSDQVDPLYTKAFASYYLLKTLLQPQVKKASLEYQTKNLHQLGENLSRHRVGSEPIDQWILNQAKFLQGKLDLDDIKKIAQTRSTPPAWVLAIWLEDLDLKTAHFLSLRAEERTELHEYITARLELKQGDIQSAINRLEKIAKLNNVLIWQELTKVSLELKQYRTAEKWAKRVLKRSADNINGKLLLARVWHHIPAYEDKVDKIYQDLLGERGLTNREKIRIYEQKAELTINAEMKAGLYQKILNLDSKHTSALYHLGKLYLLENNNKAKSIEYFEKFIRYSSASDPEVQKLKKMVYSLKLELSQSQMEERAARNYDQESYSPLSTQSQL